MKDCVLEGFYDVIIVGAGIAGLECARYLLNNSDLKILVIEKEKDIGTKPCAGGVTPKDLEYIPKKYLNHNFQKIRLSYKNKLLEIPTHYDCGVISTFNRKGFLEDKVKSLTRYDKITFCNKTRVKQILSNNALILSLGSKYNKIKFKYLVGADGSLSAIRAYLGLGSKRLIVAHQYIIAQELKDFEIHIDDKDFGSGYAWIFPHKGYSSIGAGADIRSINPKLLKLNLDHWITELSTKLGFKLDKVKFESAIINYDYRGYRFGNIFLAGDAAGLSSGISGKGIYAAHLSARQVARDIINDVEGADDAGDDNSQNRIIEWISKKKEQEKYAKFLKNRLVRKKFFSFVMQRLSDEEIQKRAIELLS